MHADFAKRRRVLCRISRKLILRPRRLDFSMGATLSAHFRMHAASLASNNLTEVKAFCRTARSVSNAI